MAGGGAHRSSLLQPYIKCRYQNRSINACINKSCIKYAFMCYDKTCECQNGLTSLNKVDCCKLYFKELEFSLFFWFS